MLVYVVRAMAMYLVALIVIRLMGKRALGELGLFDFVVMTGVGHILTSVALDQSLPFYEGVAVLITLAALEYGVAFLSIKSQKLNRIIQGRPVIMIRNGKIIKENLGKEKFNVDDLMQELRKQGVRDVNEVETGILEPSGGFSVIIRGADEPVSRGDLGIEWEPDPNSILTYDDVTREKIFTANLEALDVMGNPTSIYVLLEDIQGKLNEILKRLDCLEGESNRPGDGVI
ncbi:MAG: DUF421 domain-containing protein [Syntrophomonadaceae bacterium]|nr:DUF421 domain-containing protein [Syntrophomonadaceae bacterium]